MPPCVENVDEVPAIGRDVDRVNWVGAQIELCDCFNQGYLAWTRNAGFDKGSVCVVDTGALALENGRKNPGSEGCWWMFRSTEGLELVTKCIQGLHRIYASPAGLVGQISFCVHTLGDEPLMVVPIVCEISDNCVNRLCHTS